MVFVLAFSVFVLASAAMAVGCMLFGKRLSGSCGGVDGDGRPLAECLCEKRQMAVCDLRARRLAVGSSEPS